MKKNIFFAMMLAMVSFALTSCSDKESEGKSRFTEGFAENKVNFAVRMGGSGESLLQLTHRVYSALDDISSPLT